MRETWSQVDDYYGSLLGSTDPALDAVMKANQEAGLPAIDLTPLQGKFLHLLARISGARRILEVGTLGGYSTIWLARALPPDGNLITLELEPHHAEVAHANLQHAGVLDRVDLRLGPAADTLRELISAATKPFDFIFIDADKSGYPEYLDLLLNLARPGTVIVADNVVRDARVLDKASDDPDVQGIRHYAQKLSAEPRLSSTMLQTVSAKGYDGFAISVVTG